MLTAELKNLIQDGYRSLLKAKGVKSRLGQRQMIAAIAGFLGEIDTDAAGRRVSAPGVCAVEAGTGTGKTLAYLLATLPVARAAGKKIVIATGTVALQGQLVSRDIPEVLAATGWAHDVIVAKGRSRYLCPLRLERWLDVATAQSTGQFLFDDEIPFCPDAESLKLFADMARALDGDAWNGDRDAWPDALPDATWRALTVDRRQCTGHRCRLIGTCCFFRARDHLEEADCIVANHDLVMADLALGGGVILPSPEQTLYIFDEAHRLGATALQHFAGQCRLLATMGWLEQMQKQLAIAATDFSRAPDLAEQGLAIAESSAVVVQWLQKGSPIFQERLDHGEQRTDSRRYRFPGGKVDDECAPVCAQLAVASERLRVRLEKLHDVLESALDNPHHPVPRTDLEQYFEGIGQWLSRAEVTASVWSAMLSPAPEAVPPLARWVAEEDGDIRISVSPITASTLLGEQLWQRCYAAVLTSATLRTLGGFARSRTDLGLPEDAPCTSVVGAFDYHRVGVLAVPESAADGGDAASHTSAIVEYLPTLITASEGTLVLFASKYQMEEVAGRLLDKLGDSLLVQGQLSTLEIVRRHRSRIDDGAGSVIFGLANFAEGMDLPGDYCRHVIVAKLPFAVPDDPVQAALADWIEARGGNAFRELSLPDASLRLVQACGRLIRTETDSGRVTILDRRLLTKGYGRQLLEALPPFRREFG